MKQETHSDKDVLAKRAAELIEQAGTQAIEQTGSFVWAVSGGSTPQLFLQQLATLNSLDWSKVHLFQVDERVAPDGSEQRNATMLNNALFAGDNLDAADLAGLWLMPVTDSNLESAAADYVQCMQNVLGDKSGFDLVQLGLGEDGHTASLVPEDPVLNVDDFDVAITDVYKETRRMTLTVRPLNAATQQLWVISGESKKDAFTKYLNGDRSIPAGLLNQDNAVVLVDEAAAQSCG